MAQLKRIARSKAVPGVGYARRGVIQTVPEDMVEELLKTGEWARPGEEIGASAEPSDSPDPVDAPDNSDESEDESEDDSEGEETEGESERVTEPAPTKPARRSRRKSK